MVAQVSSWEARRAAKARAGEAKIAEAAILFFFFKSILAYGLYHGESPWLRKAT